MIKKHLGGKGARPLDPLVKTHAPGSIASSLSLPVLSTFLYQGGWCLSEFRPPVAIKLHFYMVY